MSGRQATQADMFNNTDSVIVSCHFSARRLLLTHPDSTPYTVRYQVQLQWPQYKYSRKLAGLNGTVDKSW